MNYQRGKIPIITILIVIIILQVIGFFGWKYFQKGQDKSGKILEKTSLENLGKMTRENESNFPLITARERLSEVLEKAKFLYKDAKLIKITNMLIPTAELTGSSKHWFYIFIHGKPKREGEIELWRTFMMTASKEKILLLDGEDYQALFGEPISDGMEFVDSDSASSLAQGNEKVKMFLNQLYVKAPEEKRMTTLSFSLWQDRPTWGISYAIIGPPRAKDCIVSVYVDTGEVKPLPSCEYEVQKLHE